MSPGQEPTLKVVVGGIRTALLGVFEDASRATEGLARLMDLTEQHHDALAGHDAASNLVVHAQNLVINVQFAKGAVDKAVGYIIQAEDAAGRMLIEGPDD